MCFTLIKGDILLEKVPRSFIRKLCLRQSGFSYTSWPHSASRDRYFIRSLQYIVENRKMPALISNSKCDVNNG